MKAHDPLAPPLRIAFAGDWHANAWYAQRAIRHAVERGADVILHLGDYGYDFPPGYLEAQEKILAETDTPLIFVDGNHEDHPKLAKWPIRPNGLRQLRNHIWHTPRGFRWEWEGVRFLACGGAYSVDRRWRVPGVSWWREEEITDDDVAACGTEPVDVLLAHDCPAGVVIPGIDERDPATAPFPWVELVRAGEHRQRLQRIVDAVRPRWIWHGHYHRKYQQQVEWGYGPVTVTGLDCDDRPLDSNMHCVDLLDFVLAKEGVS
ncbi:MAG TPA: metallophosphoesterase [Rugosimonospora sp.]|nr:metallophosphoesterase [Rugosimonospora sp.]